MPTRGFLIATRRKVIVEQNEFLATHMSAIHSAIDANRWCESGYVRDMTIRNNRFIRCAEPVIGIAPRNRDPNNSVYENIRIENNEFLLRDKLIVKAKSTKNLGVTGNTIVSKRKLTDEESIRTDDCVGQKVERNLYLVAE